MTMNIKMSVSCHPDYAALVKIAGKPDLVLGNGEETELTLWESVSAHIFEVSAVVQQPHDLGAELGSTGD